jgi:uncharacterized protein (UPF0210 family)
VRRRRNLGVQAKTVLGVLFAIAAIFGVALAADASPAPSKPKVRTITAFVRLDRPRYQEQIQQTLSFLRAAKVEYEKAGFEVETIRITTQPFPDYTRHLPDDQVLAFFRDYDALAVKEGFIASIGPAMMSDADDPHEAELLGRILANSKALDGSIFIAGEDGIHWKSIQAAASVIKYLEANTTHSQGNFNFTASSLVPSGAPFYPASYFAGERKQFAIGLESTNVVSEVLASTNSPSEAEVRLKEDLGAFATQIEKIATEISAASGWDYGGIDLSPAPLKDVSIGRAFENYLGKPLGSSGTLTTAALITRALKAIPVKQAGYSGLMLPVLEDTVIAQRWSEGRLSIDAMLSYSAVCGTGLDTIPLPGDVTPEQLARILGDVASLSVKWHKPLSARLQPVTGKKPGEMTQFDSPFLVDAKIQPLP